MIFSYRSGLGFRKNKNDAYKLGLAKVDDSGAWERVTNNLQMIDQHSSSWDDQMVAYPHVFEFRKTTYMLYCGNDFEKVGFGAAVLES